MSPEALQTLAALLRQLAAEGLGTPRMPREIFPALRGVVAQPTAELLLSRTGSDVLLTRREDRNWQAYHLPGGFVGAGEGLGDACARIAKVELGHAAKLVRIVGHYTWSDHPYASPLSLLCLCTLEGETEHGRYFDVDDLPADLMPQHAALIRDAWPERR